MVSGSYWSDSLKIDYPIRQGTEVIGTLSIVSDLKPMWTATAHRMLLVFAGALVAFVAALLLAARLQRSVSGPILDLTRVMRLVASGNDYSQRLPVQRRDEVGELISGFNAMLHEVESRDDELREHRATLEKQVESRTAQLRLAKEQAESANVAKSRFLANMSPRDPHADERRHRHGRPAARHAALRSAAPPDRYLADVGRVADAPAQQHP
ncbi:MAG: HAMP domain-containing protein [Candidatus Accumulibacter propinquus]